MPSSLGADGYLVLSGFSFWSHSWLYLVSFLSVVPLVVVQNHVNQYYKALGLDPAVNGRFSLLNLVFCIAGGAYLAWYVSPIARWLFDATLWCIARARAA